MYQWISSAARFKLISVPCSLSTSISCARYRQYLVINLVKRNIQLGERVETSFKTFTLLSSVEYLIKIRSWIFMSSESTAKLFINFAAADASVNFVLWLFLLCTALWIATYFPSGVWWCSQISNLTHRVPSGNSTKTISYFGSAVCLPFRSFFHFPVLLI